MIAGGVAAPPLRVPSRKKEELGLKLEAHKLPYDYLVVDRVEKIPTRN
jgi:uncharacterized protein (TIGR03435 family)